MPHDPSMEPRILPLASAAGPDETAARRSSPRGLLEAVVAEQSQARRERGLPPFTVDLDVAEEHFVQADPALIRRVFAALLANAMDASDRDTSVREVPRLREIVVTSVASADAIEIEVADSGPGLPARVKARLFDRQSTTAPDAAGPDLSGAWLAEVRTIVERLGGTLHAADCPDGGAAFTLRLPHRRARRMAA